jgi:hypothetical protein
MFRIALGCVVGMLSAAPVFAQQPAAAAPAQQPAAQANPFVFPGDGGAVLNFVKADKTADFEMIMGKVKEALGKSDKPERKQQATGWKIFKASEPGPNGAVIYAFVIDPVVKGGDYSVGNILVEGFGSEEGRKLYQTYSESFGNPAIGALLHLTQVADLGK